MHIMNILYRWKSLYLIVFTMSWLNTHYAQTPAPTIVGEMKNVMWKGQLMGTINLDTLQPKQHLYGLGPIEYLSGEIMIFDGITYTSKVLNTNNMEIQTKEDIKAPFFAYAHISAWTEVLLDSTVNDAESLETFLNQQYKDKDYPYFFKLEGHYQNAKIHIVNLPHGTKVTRPQEAHQGQVNYFLPEGNGALLGFFSRKHQSIFTHHDTYIHMHLLTEDKKQMGHLEQIHFYPNQMKLFISKP